VISDMPAPLVPIDVDLRGYEFMPLYGDRLFASETWVNASADGKVAMLRLWWHAWSREVPAGSLPDSDKHLSEFAGYGVAVKAWRKIKPEVMPGWIKCSDGRLYHDRLFEWALEAWDKRVKDRQRKANFRAARTRTQRGQDADGTRTERGASAGQDGSGTVEREAKRSDSEVRELQNRDVGVSPPYTASPPPEESSKVNGAIENTAKSKAKTLGAGQQWDDPSYVAASARNVDKPRREGEPYDDWRDRVITECQQRQTRARA
jgi:hypothetical protein